MKKNLKITIYSISAILLLIFVLILGPNLFNKSKQNGQDKLPPPNNGGSSQSGSNSQTGDKPSTGDDNQNPSNSDDNNSDETDPIITLVCNDVIEILPNMGLKFSNQMFKIEPINELSNIKFKLKDNNSVTNDVDITDFVFTPASVGDYYLTIYISDTINRTITINVKDEINTNYLSKTTFDIGDNIDLSSLVDTKYSLSIDDDDEIVNKTDTTLTAINAGSTNISLLHNGITYIQTIKVLPTIEINNATTADGDNFEIDLEYYADDIIYSVFAGDLNNTNVEYIIESDISTDPDFTTLYNICFMWDELDENPLDYFNLTLTIKVNGVSKTINIKVNVIY